MDFEVRKDLEVQRQRIIAHEQICEIRQGQIRTEVANLRAEFIKLGGKLDKWMYGVFALLIASLAYFIVRFGLPGTIH